MAQTLIYTIFFSCLFCETAFAQMMVVLEPIKDNTLIEVPDTNSNGAGLSIFSGKTGSNASIRRALLQFDIAGNIPSGMIIDSVELQLYMDQAPNTTSQNFELHSLLSNWGEGSSAGTGGQGAPAQANDATWNYAFYNAQLWSVAGGDFDTLVESNTSIGAIGYYAFSSTNELVSTVQYWLDTASNNFGWLIKGNEIDPSTTKRFCSREYTDNLKRPKLTVWYSLLSNVIVHEKITPSVIIYPNPPNNGYINIESLEENIELVQVFNYQGIAVVEKKQNNSTKNNIKIDVSDLPSGIYTIFIKTKSQIITKQITII